jgi:hypothetical protein
MAWLAISWCVGRAMMVTVVMVMRMRTLVPAWARVGWSSRVAWS